MQGPGSSPANPLSRVDLSFPTCMMGVGLERTIPEAQCEESDCMKERPENPGGGRAGLLVLCELQFPHL